MTNERTWELQAENQDQLQKWMNGLHAYFASTQSKEVDAIGRRVKDVSGIFNILDLRSFNFTMCLCVCAMVGITFRTMQFSSCCDIFEMFETSNISHDLR